MSQERQTQWARRLDRLHGLRDRFSRSGHYDRARKASLIVQRVYERWADEVFAARA